MSPTSYQTAPPRSPIITIAHSHVKPRDRGADLARFAHSWRRSAAVSVPQRWRPDPSLTKTHWLNFKSGHLIVPTSIQRTLLGRAANTFLAAASRLDKETAYMAKKENGSRRSAINAQPRIHQRAPEIQAYGTVS